ncbi:hypothetical protein D9M71_797750 [compost metagenome]
MSECIDHLLRIRGFVGHDAAPLTPDAQGLSNMLGMLNVGGNHQTSRIRFDLAKLIQFAAAEVEQLIDHLVMPQQFFVGDGGFP